MPHYRRVGDIPRKRHTRFVDGDGRRLAEELMGEEGFSGGSTLLYHRGSPSAILSAGAVSVQRSPLSPNEPLLPWHLRCPSLTPAADVVTARHVLLGNATVTICWAAAGAGPSPLYRNAAGDELVYVQSGDGVLESVFGALTVGAGDYVVVPMSTTHRWVAGASGLAVLVVEAAGHVDIPARYLTERGQLREGAPFSERDLRAPEAPLLAHDEGPVEVLVRTRSGWSSHCQAAHPFDVVGWDGCVYPFVFNIADFEPIVGRIHQPPPVHQTFAGPGFVVCSFVPRLFDTDPAAIKVPYHHANVDSDEVLFYSAGDFMSRRGAGIAAASITMHPAGFVHGPQPGSVEASMTADRTEETAVMLDTFSPLLVSAAARSVADERYPRSWAG